MIAAADEVVLFTFALSILMLAFYVSSWIRSRRDLKTPRLENVIPLLEYDLDKNG